MPDTAPFDAARIAALAATLPPNARQLVQAGAGDGALARKYRGSYPASGLVVVESDPAAAQRATGFAERVIQVRLDSAGADFYRHLQWADCWLFDGTLERLQAPAQVLARIRAVLQFDACVVACVANSAAPPATAAAAPGLDTTALQTLFADSGFRLASALELRPGAAPGSPPAPASHFLIKAMPA